MFAYLERVTEDLLVTCILCSLLYTYSEISWGKTGKTLSKAGILLGLVCSAAMAWAKNNTSKIATNTWNLYIFYVGIVLTVLYLVLVLVGYKKTEGVLPKLASAVSGLLTADLLFYEVPDVMAYPFKFNIGDNSVFSMEYLRRFLGWLFALILLYAMSWCIAYCVRRLKKRGFCLFFLVLELLENGARFFGLILSKWLVRPKVWPYFVSKEHPWAFPYAKFVSNKELLIFMIALATAVLIPVLLFCRSLRVTEPYDNPAQHRKLRAANRNRRRAAAAGVITFAAAIVIMTAVHAYNNREIELSAPETYTFSEDKSEILISIEDVSDGHLHRFEYVTPNGVDVRWIIIKKTNSASFGIGLDACDVCGTAGYYERDGSVVCKRCDVVMNINTIGFKGGCNPIPIDYRVENGSIIFELEDIIASEKNF